MSVTAIATPGSAAPEEEPAAEGGGGKKKKILIVLVILLVVGGGGYWKFRPQPPAPPEPGTVVALDAIQINLAGEHYLRMGLALQLTASAKEADGSKALDAAIDEFSGKPIADVTNPEKRRAMKKELTKHLGELYEDEVMGIYFTEFVTQ